MAFLKRVVIFLLLIILLGLLSIYYNEIKSTLTWKASSLSSDNENAKFVREPAFVIKVVDGDTIRVDINGKNETIRLLGINTPEKSMPEYQIAKEYLINNILNKSIELLRDNEDLDRYDRKLRYIFYENRLINVEIIEKGLATTFMLEDLKYRDKFETAEKFAINNQMGMWEKSSDKCSNCIFLIELNPVIDYFIIQNNCEFNCDLKNWFVKDDANHFFYLNELNAGTSEKYDSIKIFKAEVWNDNGDRFFIRDNKGNLVLFYEY